MQSEAPLWGGRRKGYRRWGVSFSLPSYMESATEHTRVEASSQPNGAIFFNMCLILKVYLFAINCIFNSKVIVCHQRLVHVKQ